MKPCCFRNSRVCIDLAVEGDYPWCEENDGTLGPEGTCCEHPDGGFCTAPDSTCWPCPWNVDDRPADANCCFPALDYQWFESIRPGQCNACGGGASTQEDCVEGPPSELRPCCTMGDVVGSGPCFNHPPQFWQACVDDGGVLGPEGTCCHNPHPLGLGCFHNPCWKCAYDIDDPMGMSGSCCFADVGPQWFGNIKFEQCISCNEWGIIGVIGEPDVGEDECQAPEPIPECIDAPREDRPNPAIIDDQGTHLQWTLDTIGTVVFARSAARGNVPRGLEDPRLQGYQYPISAHLIRPMQADTPAESCGHAGGRMTMLDDGYVYVETCSKPDRTDEDSFRRSYGVMRTFLPEEDTALARQNRALGMEDGYQYSVTCIRLPWWAEALYRSRTARCGTDPV